MGLLGWLGLIWLGSKMLPGVYGKAGGGPAPQVGGETTKADGAVHRLEDGTPLLACAGKWWAIEKGGVCCRGASGTAVTLTDGRQVVCAFSDELSSYRWLQTPE